MKICERKGDFSFIFTSSPTRVKKDEGRDLNTTIYRVSFRGITVRNLDLVALIPLLNLFGWLEKMLVLDHRHQSPLPISRH